MAKQNVSTQINEQRSEKAGRKRCIKLELIYRNNHPNRYLHWANCCNSKSVFLHNCLLHIIPKIFPGHLWTVLIRDGSWDFSVNASKTNDERPLSASERNVPPTLLEVGFHLSDPTAKSPIPFPISCWNHLRPECSPKSSNCQQPAVLLHLPSHLRASRPLTHKPCSNYSQLALRRHRIPELWLRPHPQTTRKIGGD